LSRVFVNIIDLLECWDKEEQPRLFSSQKELSKYAKKGKGKTFGREIAKQDKVLRVLLKKLY
jgi:hypothetical protein